MIRTRVLLICLSCLAIATTALGLTQIFVNIMELTAFVRSIGSLVILGLLASFLAAIDYDVPTTARRRFLLIALCILAVGVGGLIVAQIWGPVLDWPLFVKALISMGAGMALAGFVLALAQEVGSNRTPR